MGSDEGRERPHQGYAEERNSRTQILMPDQDHTFRLGDLEEAINRFEADCDKMSHEQRALWARGLLRNLAPVLDDQSVPERDRQALESTLQSLGYSVETLIGISSCIWLPFGRLRKVVLVANLTALIVALLYGNLIVAAVLAILVFLSSPRLLVNYLILKGSVRRVLLDDTE